MKKSKILLLTFIAFAISFWGCQKSEMPVESQQNFNNNYSLNKTIISKPFADAILFIYVNDKGYQDWPAEQKVNVHRVTNAWEELEATWIDRLLGIHWDKPGGDVVDILNPPYILDYAPPGNWMSHSIKDIVLAWKNGKPNYGVLLEQGPTSPYLRYRSKDYNDDNDEFAPYLKLIYSDGSDKIINSADTYIWELFPDGNNGNSEYLYTGLVGKIIDGQAITKEKRTLLKFDVEFDEGCTLTQGYWKTHAKGHKYDKTWDQIGTNTVFFNSGISYIKVLWTSPRKGNAYYILAHQYIVAELNQLNGASVPQEVKNAFDKATDLFDASSGDTIGNIDRQEWIDLTEILESYNSGDIGPGHCDDYKWHKKHKKCGKDKWGKWWKNP